MYTLKYDKNIKEFRHRDSCFVRMRKEKGMFFKECKYYVIHDYYPLSGIGNDVDINIKNIRNFIFSFKDGRKADVEYAANIIVESLKKESINIENTCLMIIPASKPEKTNKRFEYFCSMVAKALNIENGFNYLSAIEHEETKGSSDKNIRPFLILNSEQYKGKNVLLFDDVITSGSSFKQVAAKLLETGAKSVTGLFLAKTTRE
ncbi:phosphoribosyltransferase [Bacteroides ovatus]|jgi:ATP-dependent DNA helicase RecQ|uniref:ComF family protein n=1 Tax=Bacteroides ovatus TaxID=28116 RepID=UPI0020A7B01E|nr:phosphoribosyltransferase [Bacteroides ovatus]MCS2299496.1 phosphoribosyltransferase [Bacteroides ovatus]MDC2433514.1 phosphoribosyltransferase [Bacteroides ovatus]MDC2449008.1 phosphoribosyltransferase [Bacteroides ovatus]MDC2464164.1 phosphoribosyltransferase [Bacteroides ovatus]MDC2484027.1 phosphoribosyltransferase [Bacteroides ovatus]